MNYIEFDTNKWIQYNAENASVFKDNDMHALISIYGTDAITLFDKCGLTFSSGQVLIYKTGNYYKLQVQSSTAVFGISYAICGVKFNDHSHTDTYFGKGQEQTSFVLLQGVYGFDELNILLNPNYLYLQNGATYFYQLGCSNQQINTRYPQTSPLPEIRPSLTAAMYFDPVPSDCLDGEQYSMPNYNINNVNIHSVGLHRKQEGTNRFKYNGRVFGVSSATNPPNQFDYQHFIPHIIYVKGYTNESGYSCSSYTPSSNGTVTVVGSKPNSPTITKTYQINDNCKLVRYRRDNTAFTLDTSVNLINSSYFQFKNYTGYYDYYVMLLGNRDNNSATLPLNIKYSIKMNLSIFQNNNGVNTTESLYESIIKSKSFIKTYYFSTTGDFAPELDDFQPTIGRCAGKNKKYTTNYNLTLRATIDEVGDLAVNLPNSHGGSFEPYISSLSYVGTETINNPIPIGSSGPAEVSHNVTCSIKGAYNFTTPSDSHCYATIPNGLYLSQLQHKGYFDDSENTYFPRQGEKNIKTGETNNGFCGGEGGSGEGGYTRGCGVNNTLIFDDLGTAGEGSSNPNYLNSHNRRIKIDCSQAYICANSGATEIYDVLVLGRKDGYINPYDD